jgi:hypothetical protein
VGVPDAEEGVALALGEMLVADTGPVVRGGQEQGPAGRVTAEDGGVGGSGHGPHIHDARLPLLGLGRLTVDDMSLGALRGENPPKRIGDDLGPGLVGNTKLKPLTCENITAPICATPGENLVGEGAGVVVGEGEIEESGAGDLDAGDAGTAGEAPRKELGDVPGRAPGGPGQLQRDVGGVVPAPTGPRPLDHDACRHGHAQLTVVDRAAHGALDGTGELDGGHGTSVWEEGGG